MPSDDLSLASTAELSRVAHSDPPATPSIVKTLSDENRSLRVAIFGLTVPMITERMSVRHTSPYVFDDPLVTAARLVPLLRETYQPDLLVALSHIGINQDRKLAETVPGIDLIIGGHTHVVLEYGERVGDTLLVQGGSHGRFWGRVDILPAADTSSRPRLSAALYPLPKTPDDAQMQAQIHMLEISMPMYLPKSHTQHACIGDNLSMAAVALLLVACWIASSAGRTAWDRLSLPNVAPAERFAYCAALGLGVAAYGIYGLGLCGLLSFWPVTLWWLLLAALGIPGTRSFLQDIKQQKQNKSSQRQREKHLQSRRHPFAG